MNNDRELDTALDRVFDGGSQHTQRRTRSVALWMTMAVLIVAGLGAAVWARGGLSTPRRTTARPTRVAAKPAPVVQQARPKETHRRSVTLSVSSKPRATVFIDGARIGDTPIAGRALTVGRSYQIRVERKGYRTKRETIAATGTRPITRSYVLQKERRR